MSLQWTLVAGFLYGEMALVLLFILPFISARGWNRFFKSRFLQVLAKQATWYFAIILVMLVMLLLDAIREIRKYSDKTQQETTHAHLENELQTSMRLFRAQRNLYISGFALFLALVIKRFVHMISRQAQLEAENEAALKQARSASAAARSMVGDQAGDEKLKKELEEAKNKVTKLEKDREALVSQSSNLEKEYDRLLEEHRKLQLGVGAQGESKKDE